MRQNLELLDEIEEFTRDHSAVAVKTCTERGDCWVYLNGEQMYEPGGTAPFPVNKPGEPIEYIIPVLTKFWFGRWDEDTRQFVPVTGPLSGEDFLRKLRF